MRLGFQFAIVAATLAFAIPASAVSITFNPNGFAYSYWINGTGGGSAAGVPFALNATVGETYNIRTRGNTVTVGTFTVDSFGNITESAAGLTTPLAGNLQFDNATITFNPGSSAYGYFLDWLQGNASGTVITPMPKGSGSWAMNANGLGDPDNLVTYSISNSGNVVINSVASGGAYTTSGSTLNFPVQSIFVDVPATLGAYAGTQSWGIHYITAGFGADDFADRFLTVIPGTWGLISSSLPAGSWLGGVDRFDLPGPANGGWSQSLTWVVAADSSQHVFTFYAPEPASAGLLAVGMLSLLRRRPMAGKR